MVLDISFGTSEMEGVWNASADQTTMEMFWNDTPTVTQYPLPPIDQMQMQMIRFVCEVCVSLPIAILGIVGNILAFVVLCQQKQRLTTNVLLQALAVADTLVLVSSIVLRSMRYFNWAAYNDIFHYIFIVLYPCVYFFRLADTWLTVMLTIDRYIAVCHPLHAQRVCTLRRTYITIAVIVISTFLFSLPRFFEFQLADSGPGYVHTVLVRSAVYTVVYRITLFFLAMYLVPMILLIVLNVLLLCALRRAYSDRDSMITNGNMHTTKKDRIGQTASRGVTIIVVTVVIVCVVCNVSAMVAHVLWSIQHYLVYLYNYHRVPANVSNVMVTFNCAINFAIYCLFSRKFRSGLRHTCRCEHMHKLRGRWRSEHRQDSTGTPNTSYTSVGLIPLRFSVRSSKNVAINKMSADL